nr:PREDICTED: abhydrolase domain-containing protein 2 [Latimeria chalumnae]|eukprot:XP_014340359.1 PREDICTED: abhydrolase domain-containing protein 2 [Latimeria chalumnae]
MKMSVVEVQSLSPEMPAVFDGVKLAAVAAVLYVIVRCLNLNSPTAPPDLLFHDTALNRFLFKSCPLLTKENLYCMYVVYIGPILDVSLSSKCKLLLQHFQNLRKGTNSCWFTCLFSLSEDVTMVICPGIANHSEKQYIRTFVDYAQRHGYRCAVLNHLGALTNIKLTSPRIFTYGCTWEFAAMVSYMRKAYPHTQFMMVGFSLGGNIVCKYLGENQVNQDRVLCCASVCQGYSALRAQDTFLQWDRCRRFYNFLMADNMKKIILSHREILFGGKASSCPKCLEDVELSRLYTATSLTQIDDNIMRKFHGYDTLKEYYEKESCVHYLHNIQVPLLLVNASDDPLVHDSLLTIPRSLAEKKENVIFALTLHGGHLGFFEGAVLFPEPLTWMDKLVVDYANAICQWEKNKPQCTGSSEDTGSESSD